MKMRLGPTLRWLNLEQRIRSKEQRREPEIFLQIPPFVVIDHWVIKSLAWRITCRAEVAFPKD